jgi:hypothetical protein
LSAAHFHLDQHHSEMSYMAALYIEVLSRAEDGEVAIDPTEFGASDVRRLTEQGFDGAALNLLAFTGSIVTLLRTIEWLRARIRHQVVVDLRDEATIKVEVQSPRNGLTVVIAPDGSTTTHGPEANAASNSDLGSVLSALIGGKGSS